MWGELSPEWGELSSECGASCLGASFIWGELSWGELSLGRVVRNPPEALPEISEYFGGIFQSMFFSLTVYRLSLSVFCKAFFQAQYWSHAMCSFKR